MEGIQLFFKGKYDFSLPEKSVTEGASFQLSQYIQKKYHLLL